MIDQAAGILENLLKVSALLILISLAFFWVGVWQGVAVLAGVLLSTAFVGSSAWVLDQFQKVENEQFIKVYIFSMMIRFLLVIIIFVILLATTKIDEIYFTVSFIISYLCKSVTEMIFINKIL